ncbi:C-terminal binding protein [Halogeometricum sp. S1BR25-6]|uniref:C-terminal binding protein n=1 Tax=Halogeometricum salsisoli TaxID=2950536 RepID=A0ABU2GAJ9_9EURY|nr:C-terminal binding protein [Halogeometricum sp. S1BR25-6]MDS0297815.1 C-terminal binding protein [Halogeometricum sp. S1BR25-6]
MTYQVVASDYHTVRPDVLRETLDGVADVTLVELGSTERLVDACREADADALITDIATPVTSEALDELDLSVVARAAVGFDNVDVVAAEERGVVVTNVPGYCTDEVATHTVALLLSAVRAVPEVNDRIVAGEWPTADSVAHEVHRLSGRTVGFVSFGAIARRTAEMVSGFGLDAVAYDPYLDPEDLDDDSDVDLVDFETLLERSHYVVVNAPATDETRGMFDAETFERMREDAVLVNTGRGAVVDEDALLDALDADEIDCAALDMFESEPLPPESPLRDRADLVVTSHTAWYSEEASAEVNETAAADVRRVLTGETPAHAVDPDWK